MNTLNVYHQIPFLRKCWRTNRTGKWFLIPSWRLSICVLRLNFVESVLNSAVQGPKYPIHAKFRDRSTHSRTIMSGPKYLIHDQGPKYLIHAKFWGLKSSFTIRDPSTLFTHNFQGLKSSFTFRDPSTLFTQHFCVLKSSFTFRDWNTSFTQGLKSPLTIRERNTGALLYTTECGFQRVLQSMLYIHRLCSWKGFGVLQSAPEWLQTPECLHHSILNMMTNLTGTLYTRISD